MAEVQDRTIGQAKSGYFEFMLVFIVFEIVPCVVFCKVDCFELFGAEVRPIFGNPYDQRRPLLPYDMNEKWVGIVFVDIPSQAFQSLFLIKLCKIPQIFDDFLSALFMDKR